MSGDYAIPQKRSKKKDKKREKKKYPYKKGGRKRSQETKVK